MGDHRVAHLAGYAAGLPLNGWPGAGDSVGQVTMRYNPRRER